MKLNIKNMVCNRCIKVVREELLKNNIAIKKVNLGEIELEEEISPTIKEQIKKILQKEGFEIIEDFDLSIINKVKTSIIEIIHQEINKPKNQNFSDYLVENINLNYSYLSKLFSEINGKTIEHFIIEQKIERVKELLIYDELTLSQISYELDYSSPQHLSRQFKQITGLTPTQFKKIGKRKKLDTI